MDGCEHGGTINAETDDDTADTGPDDHAASLHTRRPNQNSTTPKKGRAGYARFFTAADSGI